MSTDFCAFCTYFLLLRLCQPCLAVQEHRSPSYLWSLCFQTYPLYSWPDNIQVDEGTGDLYVASHPILHRFLVYTDDVGSLHSPSQVIKKPIRKAACLTLRTPYSRENMVKLGVEAYLSLSTTVFFFFFFFIMAGPRGLTFTWWGC